MRITVVPQESELEGVRLDNFLVGTVYDVSPSVATWLVAQGYAAPEMRLTPRDGVNPERSITSEARRTEEV